MTILLAAWAWLKKAWAWVTTHWKWLLPPLAALFWLLTRQKKIVVESGAIVEHDAAVAQADAIAESAAHAAETAEAAKLAKLAMAHEEAVKKLDSELVAGADKALEDPDKTNSFLKNVSEDMRK